MAGITRLNPGHPVTREMEDKWVKIVGILIHKFQLGKVLITSADVEAFAQQFKGEMPHVGADAKPEGIYVFVVPPGEALRLLQKEHADEP